MKETWVYYVSRDSVRGELSGKCHLWWLKPIRNSKSGYRVTWLASDARTPGLLGEYPVEAIAAWFGAERVPETDIMLMKIEQTPTPKMLAEAKKQ